MPRLVARRDCSSARRANTTNSARSLSNLDLPSTKVPTPKVVIAMLIVGVATLTAYTRRLMEVLRTSEKGVKSSIKKELLVKGGSLVCSKALKVAKFLKIKFGLPLQTKLRPFQRKDRA